MPHGRTETTTASIFTTRRAAGDAGRFVCALAVSILCLCLGPIAGAEAAPPSLNIEEPTSGSRSNNRAPTFAGITDDLVDPVTVNVYEGSSANGTAQQTLVTALPPIGGSWALGPAEELPDGVYTVQAEQTNLTSERGTSSPVTFTVDTAAPSVSLNAPPSPSNDTTPTFTGAASDTTTVVVDIYAGVSAEGEVLATADATGTGGSWTSGEAGPALPSGQYTAVAVQQSSLGGNPAGRSQPVRFTVDTTSPTVSLDAPPSPSKNTHPFFTGTASANTAVTIRIYSGATAQGTPVASATASGTGGGWTSAGAQPALASGEYTAVASQPSPVENPDGLSEPVTFTVETAAPAVTLNPPAGLSNDTTPTFTGTASDTTPVAVEIHAGSSLAGAIVSTADASVIAGTWTSTEASPALASGQQYTAVATQASSLGNASGVSASATFSVDTSSPTVTLAQPASPSGDTTPSFTGSATETTAVTVRVYAGATAKGTQVASASASGTGAAWTSEQASPALPEGQYTAVATQESALKNPAGVSAPVTFTITTAVPKVTLSQPPARSKNTVPTFTGTATDTTQISVQIYAGSLAKGTVVSTAVAAGTGAAWTSEQASPALPSGLYTAAAQQTSSLGNGTGTSTAVTFVVDTSSPTVTLTAPPARSSDTTPAFSGTASDSTQVVVQIFDSSSREVSRATATPHGGSWTSGPASPALSGVRSQYTAVATEASSLGNAPGSSATVSFEIDTLAPTVTLASPPLRSNDTTPVFSGTATDTPPVTVTVYEGFKATGSSIASVKATPAPSGSWTAAKLSPLPAGRHTFTAVARQSSSIGNPEGASNAVTFVVDTDAPTVTLSPVPARMNRTTPSFSGVASDTTPVTLSIHAGATPTGTVVASAVAPGTGGAWTSAAVAPALADGQYTAVASQASSAGAEHVGQSAAATFTVDTVAPHVTIGSPAQGAVTTGESVQVTGSAETDEHDLPVATVQLFSGSSAAAGQTPLQTLEVSVVGGKWTAVLGGLTPGAYSVRASQADEAGNRGLSDIVGFVVAPPAAARVGQAPVATITWFPAHPNVGQTVAVVANATDGESPIAAFGWDLGTGTFAPGAQAMSPSFATAGDHIVRLLVRAANGLSAVASATIPVGTPQLPLMQPFPIVRLNSTGSRSTVRLGLLKVSAPAGARITVRCTGHSCPSRSQSRVVSARLASRSIEFRRFERAFGVGSVLEIYVTKGGEVGKYTRFSVRRGRLPVRSDACLSGSSKKPIGCPSS
jgi:hypothetical protein